MDHTPTAEGMGREDRALPPPGVSSEGGGGLQSPGSRQKGRRGSRRLRMWGRPGGLGSCDGCLLTRPPAWLEQFLSRPEVGAAPGTGEGASVWETAGGGGAAPALEWGFLCYLLFNFD